MGRKRVRPQFPCGTCCAECEHTNCLLCEMCNKWFHSACEGVSTDEFKQWGEVEGEYLCTTCRNNGDTFDYLRGIMRLEQASKRGISWLRSAAKVESLLLGDNINYIPTQAEYVPADDSNTDKVAEFILKKFTSEEGTPITTSADGDCLFNATSLYFLGNETLSVELRYKTTLMMIKEESHITGHQDKINISFISPDYNEALRKCATVGGFSSVWTILGLAKVINRPIRVIYPPVNGVKNLYYRTCNTVYNADAAGLAVPVIMWSSVSKPSASMLNRKKEWLPNHFVPVVGGTKASDYDLDRGQQEGILNSTGPTSFTSLNLETQSGADEHSITINTPPRSSTPIDACDTDNSWETPALKRKRCSREKVGKVNRIDLSIKFAGMSNVESAETDGNQSEPEPIRRCPAEDFEFRPHEFEGNGSTNRSLPDIYMYNEHSDRREETHSNSIHDVHVPTDTPSMTVPDSSDEECNIHEQNLSNVIRTTSGEENQQDSGYVPVNGPFRGKLLHEKFLTSHTQLGMFRSREGTLASLPIGVKENMYFFIEKHDTEGKKNEFWDDCGAWAKSAAPAQYFLPTDGKLVFLTKREGKFCIEKSGRKFEPLDPQPSNEDLIIINRTYNKLKADNSYKRRISWLSNVPAGCDDLSSNMYIYEYIGKFPGRKVHGNKKSALKTKPYIRTKPSVKDRIKAAVAHDPAKLVHDNLNHATNMYDLPRNLKQVKNFKYADGRKRRDERGDLRLDNFADHLLNLENKVYLGDLFIRSVNHLQSGPSVILYTDEQIQDIRRFVCKDNGAILGIDKTYNLGQLHLTTTVFKNLSVYKTDTGAPPIFLGPTFLHRKSDFETFNVFFGHLAGKFSDSELEKMVIGSDDETALRKSIRRCFVGSTQLVCTRHLKQNVKEYLGKKIGVNQRLRNRMIDCLFGPDGLASAEDTIMFDNKVKDVERFVEEHVMGFAPYLEKRIIPMIRDHVNLPARIKSMDSAWTNNNAESMNNILKIGTNRRVQDLTPLVEAIRTLVYSMYKNIEKALVGWGDYELTRPFRHLELPVDVWCNKTDEGRAAYMARVYKDKGRQSANVTSSNGRLTVPCTPGGGKKPHQRKRMAAERATQRK